MAGAEDFFYFTRKQRNGIVLLLIIIVVLQLSLYWDDLFYDRPTLSEAEIVAFEKWVADDSIKRYEASMLPAAFPFNPNTANDSIWKELGLDTRTSERITKYRKKGGQFKIKDDLKRIYGVDSVWFAHVRCSIELPDDYERPSSTKFKGIEPKQAFDPNTIKVSEANSVGVEEWRIKRMISYREKVNPFREKKVLYKVYGFDSTYVEKLLPFVQIDTYSLAQSYPKEEKVSVDVGRADSLDLLKIKGVGPYTAHNILSYRKRLGGFISLKQLLEVRGMDSARYESCLPQMKLTPVEQRKLNINKATFKQLLQHPYLNYEDVKHIVNFREQSRPFERVEELQYLEGFNEVKVSQLSPYLSVKD
jgi:DNA uptake protein ComE-like DNA-binding protein